MNSLVRAKGSPKKRSRDLVEKAKSILRVEGVAISKT